MTTKTETAVNWVSLALFIFVPFFILLWMVVEVIRRVIWERTTGWWKDSKTPALDTLSSITVISEGSRSLSDVSLISMYQEVDGHTLVRYPSFNNGICQMNFARCT